MLNKAEFAFHQPALTDYVIPSAARTATCVKDAEVWSPSRTKSNRLSTLDSLSALRSVRNLHVYKAFTTLRKVLPFIENLSTNSLTPTGMTQL